MWSTTQEQHEFSSVKVWRFLKVSCWRTGSSVNNSLCWRKSVSKVCLIKHLSQSKFTKCFTRTWDHRREPTIKQTQQQISYRHSTARKKTSFNKWFTNRESIRRVFYRKHLKVPSSVLRPVRPGPESPVSFWVRYVLLVRVNTIVAKFWTICGRLNCCVLLRYDTRDLSLNVS